MKTTTTPHNNQQYNHLSHNLTSLSSLKHSFALFCTFSALCFVFTLIVLVAVSCAWLQINPRLCCLFHLPFYCWSWLVLPVHPQQALSCARTTWQSLFLSPITMGLTAWLAIRHLHCPWSKLKVWQLLISQMLSSFPLIFNKQIKILINTNFRYLESNLPSFDIVNKGSLGFLTVPDGHPEVNEGVANVGTNLSLTVRSQYRWAAKVISKKIIYRTNRCTRT